MDKINKQQVLATLNEYTVQYNSHASINTQCQIITELETLFQQYLERNPYDVEIWLRLICIEFWPPRIDFPIFQEYFQKVLAVENNSPFIYVIKAHAEYVTRYIYPETYEQLCAVKTVTNDDKAMVAYMQALAVQELVGTQPKEYEQYLLESIKYGPSYFWNHVKLGQYYINEKNPEHGRLLIAKGIQNVLHIYTDNDFKDPTDLYEHANEMVKGVHLSDPNFNHIFKQLKALELGDYDITAV